MIRSQDEVDGRCVVVESGIPEPTEITIVSRKGRGRPDTLADHLAERLSREYSTAPDLHIAVMGLVGGLPTERPARRGTNRQCPCRW
jgi:hypothetical protein